MNTHSTTAAHLPPAAHFDQLPGSAFLRLADFASTKGRLGIVPVSGSTVWRWVKEGSFPAPVKLSPSVTAWTASSIREWLAQQAQANQPQAQ